MNLSAENRSGIASKLADIYRDLSRELDQMRFSSPVFHVYNPLDYARSGFEQYLEYCRPGVPFVLLGMNPGPWGMVQTGVPFGDAQMVRDWLGIKAEPDKPEEEHLARPVHGLNCPRREVSGRRLWGWAKEDYRIPGNFFSRFFVSNYCPLAFLEESGRNRTPDKLQPAEKKQLFALCDKALKKSLTIIRPAIVLGIGKFAESRIQKACAGMNFKIGGIAHPSPASPLANKGWADLARNKIREYEKRL